MDKYIIFSDELTSETQLSKTAHNILSFYPESVLAVLDPKHAGKKLSELSKIYSLDIPIINCTSLAQFRPESIYLVIGFMPKNGIVTEQQLEVLQAVTQTGIRVLHASAQQDWMQGANTRSQHFQELVNAGKQRMLDLNLESGLGEVSEG